MNPTRYQQHQAVNINKIRGQALCFGDSVTTDEILPSEHMQYTDINYLSSKAMSGIRPTFIEEVKVLGGCILVAGINFGTGSSREQAVDCLKGANVKAVIAESFQGIFFENACNIGLPILVVPKISQMVKEMDILQIDIDSALIINQTRGLSLLGVPIPQILLEKLRGGGLMPMLKHYIIAHGMDKPYD